MKKIGFILLLLFAGQFSQGQELLAKEFYLHLGKAISTIKSDSVKLTVIDYGCLGSQINWSAKIKNIGNLTRVSFYSQKIKDTATISSELETVLDTTFTVETSILKKNLKAEIMQIKSRPVFIEGSFKIILNKANLNREFAFRRGEGLYYLLRYNKTWESYFRKI